MHKENDKNKVMDNLSNLKNNEAFIKGLQVTQDNTLAERQMFKE